MAMRETLTHRLPWSLNSFIHAGTDFAHITIFKARNLDLTNRVQFFGGGLGVNNKFGGVDLSLFSP